MDKLMSTKKDMKLINVGIECKECDTVVPIPTLLSEVPCTGCGIVLQLSDSYKKHLVSYYKNLGILERQIDLLKEK